MASPGGEDGLGPLSPPPAPRSCLPLLPPLSEPPFRTAPTARPCVPALHATPPCSPVREGAVLPPLPRSNPPTASVAQGTLLPGLLTAAYSLASLSVDGVPVLKIVSSVGQALCFLLCLCASFLCDFPLLAGKITFHTQESGQTSLLPCVIEPLATRWRQ